MRGLAVVLIFAALSSAVAAAPGGDCLVSAAARYRVSLGALLAIRKVEGGWNGAAIRNRDGSEDLGIMQVNSRWLDNPQVRAAGITRQALRDDACVNYAVAAWIYRRYLNEAGGDRWKAAGYYHSHDPALRRAYTGDLASAYRQLGLDGASLQKEIQIAIENPSASRVRRVSRETPLVAGVAMGTSGAVAAPWGVVIPASRAAAFLRERTANGVRQ